MHGNVRGINTFVLPMVCPCLSVLQVIRDFDVFDCWPVMSAVLFILLEAF